ncbi:sigma-70 family RNA polymerase sigma factor [Galbibacter sp. EGI 63066]|uniref:RNA polymerase sigma factor n=1 Tax=Galbibacter sp. EGI 63066 TaxID=2993559 RepID=UPI002248C1A0|nr:sigma-70 family RNA polymerase sigma factor [Galbibacter sp. EGI 63066]MCX2679007.1 sigma-70 family RNA polymerase sigma factor [Galbibacter sp. EGI 63066]
MSNDFYTSSILPYSGIIIKICRAYTDSQEDFEDYYQETCLQIWRSKDKFRGDSKWSTWIYRLTLNICLTLVKKKKKTRQYYSTDAISQNNEAEDNTAFSDEDLNLLYEAIKQLSDVDKAVILLYLEEKPNKEIAEITGTTPNNIGVRVNRIKKRLKKLLDGKIN